MDSGELLRFRARFRLSRRKCSVALGCSERSLFNWEKGDADIPKYISLACSAYSLDLPPYEMLGNPNSDNINPNQGNNQK